MTKQRTFACLLVACVIFACEDRQLSAQAFQPGTAASGVAVPANTSSPQTPQLPAVYGNPFMQATGAAGGAQSSSTNKATPSISDDPCSAIRPDLGSAVFEPDPLGVAPSGAPDALSTPVVNVRAVNPAIKKCEGGRIIVRVETKRFYAYHVGDEIPISIQILADDGVQLNFTSLNQQILAFAGSDFLLVPVRVVSIASRPQANHPHSTLYGIELAVQTFVTRPTVTFNLDLKYAMDVPPGVKQPNWRTLTTPDFLITNTPVITAANDDEVDEGDLHPADYRSSWIQWPLMVGGLFMIAWFGFVRRLIVRFNRMRPGRVVPPEEKAWNVFTKVFSDAQDYGEFGAQYLRNIDAALRKYLAESCKMKIESLSAKEIAALMEDDSRLPAILGALNKCESVIYARADQPVKLSEKQIDELYQELKTLVPEPQD